MFVDEMVAPILLKFFYFAKYKHMWPTYQRVHGESVPFLVQVLQNTVGPGSADTDGVLE